MDTALEKDANTTLRTTSLGQPGIALPLIQCELGDGSLGHRPTSGQSSICL